MRVVAQRIAWVPTIRVTHNVCAHVYIRVHLRPHISRNTRAPIPTTLVVGCHPLVHGRPKLGHKRDGRPNFWRWARMVERGFPPDKCGGVWQPIAQTWVSSLMRGFPLVNLEAHGALWMPTYLQWASNYVAWLSTTIRGRPSNKVGDHDTLCGHPEMRDGCPNFQMGTHISAWRSTKGLVDVRGSP